MAGHPDQLAAAGLDHQLWSDDVSGLREEDLVGHVAAAHPLVRPVEELPVARGEGPGSPTFPNPSRGFYGRGLIIVGRRDPGGYRRLVDQLDRIPRTKLAVLDRAGHLPFAEQSRPVALLVAEWLVRVEDYLESRGTAQR